MCAEMNHRCRFGTSPKELCLPDPLARFPCLPDPLARFPFGPSLCTRSACVLDVVIIGAGPAGLSAALMLGRCRRRAVVCDRGTPRNAASYALHGFLTRDGIKPTDLLRIGRGELEEYGVPLRNVEVQGVERTRDGFDCVLETGERLESRMVLFATGVRDRLPAIDGLEACYGITVFHCPYCDGWEQRDRQIAVLGRTAGAAGLALALKTWSDRVVLCTNGRARLPVPRRVELDAFQIPVRDERLLRVEHEDGRVRRLVCAGGAHIECDAIFFATGQSPQSDLPARLGCEITRRGVVKTDRLGHTCVPGLYVVGDASRDVQFAVVAAAEGAKAAVAINAALQQQARTAAVAQP